MTVCIKPEVLDGDATPPPETISITTKTSLAEVLLPIGSPSSISTDRHVVIVMDALEEFSWEPLLWTLKHAIRPGCIVTLLGIMPWIPLALSCKTRFWTYDFGNLSALEGRTEWKSEKYQTIRGIVELCEQKGVVPYMQLAMGHSTRLMVLEKTTNLHASLVVLDRHLRKNKSFYAERLPSSAVMMNGEGGVDMIKIQSSIDDCESPGESPAGLPPTPQVILSEELCEILNNRVQERPGENECRTHESFLFRTRREMGHFFG